ncbi:hypothetical protein GALL_450590 [mine drainage metagenome]|uniref:Uncharacterized protein n=1 Tax=mine drainage metagenome TaxID=410659 RepID=A0A1J5PNZ9_9ZZZZ
MQQCGIARREMAAFQPQTGEFDVLGEAAGAKCRVGRWQAQRQHVPGNQFGPGVEDEAAAVFSQAAVVGQGFQRQPFQPGAVAQVGVEGLRCGGACAAIEAAGSGGGDQRMGTGLQPGLDGDHVAADQPAGWMHQHLMAHPRRFRVQAGQHPQSALVAMLHHGAVGVGAKVQMQLRMPGGHEECFGLRDAADGFKNRATSPGAAYVDVALPVVRRGA